MKKFLFIVLIVLISGRSSFAQFSVENLHYFPNIETLEDRISPYTDPFFSGLSVLTFSDASSPSNLGFRIGVYTGFSTIEEDTTIGIGGNFLKISTLGFQVGFGSSGFETYIRYVPDFELPTDDNDSKGYGAFGLGLKYDITDYITIPDIPSVSIYAEYNSQYLTKTDSAYIESQNGDVIGSMMTDHKFNFSSFNFGTIVGYDFPTVNIYAKAGIEFGNAEISWNHWVGDPENPKRNSGDISSTGFRYALGLTYYGFKIELGGRNSHFSLGIGLGVSF